MKVHSALNELGIDYRTSERVEDVYLAQIYIPEKDLYLDYSNLSNYLKTENMNEEQLLNLDTHMREQTILGGGNKYTRITFLDYVNADRDHSEFVKVIKEKVESA